MFFIWLFLYGTVMLLSHHFASLAPWVLPAGSFINTLTLVGWLLTRQQGKLLAFKKLSSFHWKIHLFFLPYLLPALYHFFSFGFQFRSVLSILCIFFAAIQEEVFFRGIFLRLFSRKHTIFGIVLSSLTFAAAHFLNLENGAEPLYVLYQAIYALAIGFALAGVSLTCESLLPCIGIHFLINITASDSLALPVGTTPLFWLCIVVCFICGVRSIYFLRKQIV